MKTRSTETSVSFATDDRGSVAIVFALMFLILLFVAGMAIDYERSTHARTKVAAAVDAAALAAGRAMLDTRLSDAEVKAIALKFFDENIKQGGPGFHDIKGVTVTLDRAKRGVTITVDTEVPMTITRIAGFDKAAFPVNASTVINQRDLELGMALDITGSMSGQKLTDLKDASQSLIDILLPDGGTPNKVRIGLAPYSASVRAGTFASVVTGGLSLDGCVWERSGIDAYTDALPVGRSVLGGGAAPRDIDATEGNGGYTCVSSPVAPLSSDKTSLKRSIRSFRADGWTAGHLGAAWAWYLVSPEWNTVWPGISKSAAYDTSKTQKAIVLMTDGVFNTSYKNGRSADQALALCGQMKGASADPEQHKVQVYAVAFDAPPAAEATLKACASSTAHYYSAKNGAELKAAFEQIAKQLNNLRLTQ